VRVERKKSVGRDDSVGESPRILAGRRGLSPACAPSFIAMAQALASRLASAGYDDIVLVGQNGWQTLPFAKSRCNGIWSIENHSWLPQLGRHADPLPMGGLHRPFHAERQASSLRT
jgi:hypothetical protein